MRAVAPKQVWTAITGWIGGVLIPISIAAGIIYLIFFGHRGI